MAGAREPRCRSRGLSARACVCVGLHAATAARPRPGSATWAAAAPPVPGKPSAAPGAFSGPQAHEQPWWGRGGCVCFQGLVPHAPPPSLLLRSWLSQVPPLGPVPSWQSTGTGTKRGGPVPDIEAKRVSVPLTCQRAGGAGGDHIVEGNRNQPPGRHTCAAHAGPTCWFIYLGEGH